MSTELLTQFEKIPNEALTDISGNEDSLTIDNLRSEIDFTASQPEVKQVTETSQPQQNKPGINNIIDGKVCVSLLDSVAPVVLALLAGWAGIDVSKDAFKLEKDERGTLEILFDNWTKSLDMKLTPTQELLIGLGFIYGSKSLPIIQKIGEAKKTVPKEKQKEEPKPAHQVHNLGYKLINGKKYKIDENGKVQTGRPKAKN